MIEQSDDTQWEAPAAEKRAGVVANSLWLIFAQAIRILVSAAVSVYAIRSLSPTHWGQYSTAFAFVLIFTVLSGLGFAQLALREMAADPTSHGAIFAQALSAELVATGVAVTALAVAAVLAGYSGRVLALIAILSPFVLIEPFLTLCQSAFTAAGRLVYASAFQVTRALVYAVTAAALLLIHLDVVGLALAYLGGGIAGVVTAVVLLRRRLDLPVMLTRQRVRHFIALAVPIAGVSLVTIVYDRIDVLMLSSLSSARSVAEYTVPYTWIRLTWVIPSIIAGVFFPVLAEALGSRREEAQRQFLLVSRVFLFLSVPLSLLLAVGSPTLVEGVFGRRYSASVIVLQIVAWTTILGFQNYVLWYGLLAIHRERLVLVLQLAGLAINVAMNAVLIPRYGPVGASCSLLASDVLVVGGQAVIVHRMLFPLPVRRLLAKPAAVGVVAIPVGIGLARVQPLLGGVAGALLYATMLLASRYITPREWQPLAAGSRRILVRIRNGEPPV